MFRSGSDVAFASDAVSFLWSYIIAILCARKTGFRISRPDPVSDASHRTNLVRASSCLSELSRKFLGQGRWEGGLGLCGQQLEKTAFACDVEPAV